LLEERRREIELTLQQLTVKNDDSVRND
jgi:hypothetical protein